MTRTVLPDPSAQAEWLLAGFTNRALHHWGHVLLWTVDLATTTTQTPRLAQQYQMTTMTSLPSPVNRSHPSMLSLPGSALTEQFASALR